MPSLFPNSNLSTASQPWGREVEKRLVNLDLTVNSNEINNTARDNQLANSLTRVNAALINAQSAANAAAAAAATAQSAADDAQNAIDSVISVEEAVYYPGTTEIDGGNIRANTIAANKISAGTLTGFIVNSAATGARIEISGTTLTIFDATNQVASIYGDSNSLIINGGTNAIGIGDLGVAITGGSSSSMLVSDTGIYANGYAEFQSTSKSLGLFTANSGISVASGGMEIKNPGGALASNYLQVPDTYIRTVASGRIVYVSSIGTYNCSTSSARYKQDITPYEVDVDKLLMLEPVSFRYKQSVAEVGDAADVAHGFIAEQAHEIGLSEFVDFELDENGEPRPDNFRYIDFTAALLGAFKKQQETINTLSSKIEALENA
jgi:hypothetical protein